jgi:hypothetical protein
MIKIKGALHILIKGTVSEDCKCTNNCNDTENKDLIIYTCEQINVMSLSQIHSNKYSTKINNKLTLDGAQILNVYKCVYLYIT